MLLFLFSLGHALEERALDRARAAVRALADLAPKTALVRRDGPDGLALRELARGRHRAHAQADLQAGRQLGLLGAAGAGLAQRLVHQVLEHGTRALEAAGADVGEVVGDDIELRLLRAQSGLRNPQGLHHGGAPLHAACGNCASGVRDSLRGSDWLLPRCFQRSSAGSFAGRRRATR